MMDYSKDIEGLSPDPYLNKDLNDFARYMYAEYKIELSDELMDEFFMDWYSQRLNREEVLAWKKKWGE